MDNSNSGFPEFRDLATQSVAAGMWNRTPECSLRFDSYGVLVAWVLQCSSSGFEFGLGQFERGLGVALAYSRGRAEYLAELSYQDQVRRLTTPPAQEGKA